MDVSTAGAALAITALRLLHIVAGLLWVGAALMMSLYIEPTAAASGADGKRFLRAPAMPVRSLLEASLAYSASQHLRVTRFPVYIAVCRKLKTTA